MTMRAGHTPVIFKWLFVLKGLEGVQPSGTYRTRLLR